MSGEEFHDFVQEYDGKGKIDNDRPFVERERRGFENIDEERDVKNDAMNRDGHENCESYIWVRPRGDDQERLVLRKCVESVKHLDSD